MGKISQYPSNVNGSEEILHREEGILRKVDTEQGKVIEIEEGMPHNMAETICIFCGKRAVDIWPEGVLLKDLECSCGRKGGIICTGQPMEDA